MARTFAFRSVMAASSVRTPAAPQPGHSLAVFNSILAKIDKWRRGQTAPSPSLDALPAAIRAAQKRETAEERSARLAGYFRSGQAPISEAPIASRLVANEGAAPPPPDLVEIIRQHQHVNAKRGA